MTKLTKSVLATIKEVVQKQGGAGTPEFMDIATSVIRDLLRDEHGIRIRLSTLRKISARVA